MGGASPRPWRCHLHRSARLVRGVAGGVPEGAVLAQAHRLRAEFCVTVTGVVEVRPEGNANTEIATGEIEVNATSLTVLRESAPLPFQLDETAGEEARLKYRYLDLRREGPGKAIRLRSKANAAARGVLAQHDFVEIETPTLTRSTPEGARDFLVPCAAAARVVLRTAAEPAAVQAVADGRGHGAATTRSRGAIATRTSAPTGSPSSPSSTSS